MIDPAVAMLLQPELQSGEKLLWTGRPAPWSYAWARSWQMFLFSFWFGGFAIFWVYSATSATSHGGPAFFPLFGVPFVVIGLGMFLSPVWHYLTSRGMLYAVTSERAIILSGMRARSVQSFFPRDMDRLEKKLYRDGAGTLIFRTEPRSRGYGWNWQPTRQGFYSVADVGAAEQHIRRIVGDAR